LSLLLDALKRAEQEKLAKQGGAGAEAPKERPVPVAVVSTPRPASLELQPIAAGAEAPGAPSAGAARAEAAAAQNVFQAKDSRAASASNRATVLWIVGIAVGIALLGGGGYVWYEMNSFSPRIAASGRPRPVPITPAPAAAPAGPANPNPFVPSPQGGEAVPQAAGSTAAPAAAPGPAPAASAPAAPPEPREKPDAVRDAVAALLRESSATAPQEVRLTASRESRRVAPEVTSGYQALESGDLAAARKSYGAALAADASNLDALLGIATVEARAGNRMLAANYYRRALQVDPRDATARAGLASIAAPERPDGLETQLRSDIARTPESAALHFSLGNLLASESRWNEAQVEFFDAYRLDPANADLAYNLAVSLDHLKQATLAAQYYERAIKAARASGAQFDPAQAARRLAQLRG